MRAWILSALILFAAIGYVSPVRAYDLKEVSACANAKGDASIAACTRQIQSKTLNNGDLAMAYYNRGAGYVNKDAPTKADYRQAVADFTAAIRLQPNLGAAFYARGKTYDALGDHQRSAKDLAEAAILNR